MPSILDYLNTISDARYGRDVRQAIVDAISACYQDGRAGVSDLEARRLIESAIGVNESQQADIDTLYAEIAEIQGGGGESSQESTTITLDTVIYDGGFVDSVTVNNNATKTYDVTFTQTFTEVPEVFACVAVQNSAAASYSKVTVGIVKAQTTKTGFRFFIANTSGATRSTTVVWAAFQPTTKEIDLDITIPSGDGMSEADVRAITNPIQTSLDGIKTGYDGTVYSTPGEAVRTQINDLHVLIGDEPGTAISGSSIGYDGTDSGLSATDMQNAVDEVADALSNTNERLQRQEDVVGTSVSTEPATASGWVEVSYPLKVGTTYKISSIGTVGFNTSNVYGKTGANIHPLFDVSESIAPGTYRTFTPQYNDAIVRAYMTIGGAFAVSVADTLTDKVSELESTVGQMNYGEDITTLSGTIYSLAKNNINKSAGRVISATGELDGATGTNFYHITMDVTEGDSILFHSCTTGTSANHGYAFYDENGDYLSGKGVTTEADMSITVPTGAETWKYGFYKNQWTDPLYTTFLYIKTSNISKYVESKLTGEDYSAFTWNAVGDSITQNGYYMTNVKNTIGINYTNCGLSSSTLAVNNTELQNQSIYERVTSGQYADADVWTVMGGLNDCLYKSPLGALAAIGSTYDTTTVYGALQGIVEYIINQREHPRLILMTPAHSVRDNWNSATYPTTMKLVRQAIIDVGELYGIPVFDTWSISGINAFNLQKQTNPTTRDGTHWNTLGADMVGEKLCLALKDALYGA